MICAVIYFEFWRRNLKDTAFSFNFIFTTCIAGLKVIEIAHAQWRYASRHDLRHLCHCVLNILVLVCLNL